MYDFETLVERRQFDSNKWLGMDEKHPALPPEIVPFSIADMEFKNAPEIISGLQKFLDKAILGYTRAGRGYLQAVVNWMERRHHWRIQEDWVCQSIGVVPALINAVLAFTEPGDGVIVMPPVYFPFYDAVEKHGRVVVKNTLIERNGRFEIDFEDLSHCVQNSRNRLLLLCSPHNPVGRVWTKEELLRVGQLCVKNHVLIISDEIHFDLIMPGVQHTVLASLSEVFAEHCITCTSPSKTFNLAGMQVSNIMISNEQLRQRFTAQMEYSGHFGLSILGYKACELAYTCGESWLEALLPVIAENAAFVEEFMAAYIPEIRVFPLEGTFLQYWDCRGLGLDYRMLSQLMTERALIFMDEGYLFGEAGQGFERIDLACPKWVLEQALMRLRKALGR